MRRFKEVAGGPKRMDGNGGNVEGDVETAIASVRASTRKITVFLDPRSDYLALAKNRCFGAKERPEIRKNTVR